MANPEDEPIEWPIDGILDLHLFHPKDIKDLVPDYLTECRKRNILDVRIIHGKGTGTLRKTVHAILNRLPEVEEYKIAGEGMGGWGATVVKLAPIDPEIRIP